MNPITPPGITLEQLFSRGDVWIGQSRRFTPNISLDSGYPSLNGHLLNQGWPLGTLIEVCQEGFNQADWLLFAPSLLRTTNGFIVLLNPPQIPFAHALIQCGLDVDRVLILRVANKAEFLKSFVELCRSDVCEAVLAWQPQQALSYTEMRKCLLAATDGTGLYVAFRPLTVREQSSPAVLRLTLDIKTDDLHVSIFKQKGMLQKEDRVIELRLPEQWQPIVAHHLLDPHAPQELEEIAAPKSTKGNSASVTVLHGRK